MFKTKKLLIKENEQLKHKTQVLENRIKLFRYELGDSISVNKRLRNQLDKQDYYIEELENIIELININNKETRYD